MADNMKLTNALTRSIVLLLSLTSYVLCQGDEGSGGLVCLNGGSPSELEDVCYCFYPYSGQQCQNYICVHGSWSNDRWECVCENSWTGYECDVEDTCVNGFYNNEIQACQCPPLYTGAQCEKEREADDVCEHGGTYDPDVAACECPPSYIGRYCEFERTTASCQNGGSWNDATMSCSCPAGFEGVYCEIYNPCRTYPCRNFGCCEPTTTGFTCYCMPGFIGDRCETSSCSADKFSIVSASFELQSMSRCYSKDYLSYTTPEKCLQAACEAEANVIEVAEYGGEIDCEIKDCTQDPVWTFQEVDYEEYRITVYRQTEFNPCDGVSCGDHGECVVVQGPPGSLGDLVMQCHCRIGYTGALCENLADVCATEKPCAVGAQCKNDPTTTIGFVCTCAAGTFGVTCSQKQPDQEIKFTMTLTNEQFRADYNDPQSAAAKALCNGIFQEVARVSPFPADNLPLTHRCIFKSGSVIVDLFIGLDAPLPSSVLEAIRQALTNMKYPVDPKSISFTEPDELVKCSFEESFCSLAQDQADSFDWSRTGGETPTKDTGPEYAYMGDLYAFIESSQKLPGAKARLIITLPPTIQAACLTMAYILHGEDIGQLEVTQRSGAKVTVLWREGRYTNINWQYMMKKIDVTKGNKIGIVASVGNGPLGDIAIDGVNVTTDMEQCIDTANWEGCFWNAMGPHTRACIAHLWKTQCMADGDAVVNTYLDEYFSTMTFNGAYNTIQNIGQRAALGNQEAVFQCYGQYLRLANGEDNASGRVEIFMYGEWGSICDDDFDDVDAAQVCRQLGFIRGVSRSDAYYGEGVGPIHLAGLGCTGTEASILTCSRYEEVNCFHSEDVSVICERDATGATDRVGWTARPRSSVDYTEGAVFLLDPSKTVKRPGEVIQWNVYTEFLQVIYLQIWRFSGLTRTGDQYTLIGQTVVETPTMNGTSTFDLANMGKPSIPVKVGDVVGVWFPSYNPITYDTRGCYSDGERLMYQEDPPANLVVGVAVEFQQASLAWDPCRTYSIEAIIKNAEITTPAPYVKPKPTGDPNAIFYCSFEDDYCDAVADGTAGQWTRTNLPTPTYGTGPLEAFLGSYYVFVEATGQAAGAVFRLKLPKVTGKPLICLEFYYHMIGFGMGSMAVLVKDSGGTKAQWTHAGSTGKYWQWHQITMPLAGDTEIIFEGKVGSDALSDMALDDIQITSGQCPAILTTPPTIPPVTTTTTTTTISPELAAKTYYISTNGTDVEGCGDNDNTCASVGYAVNGPEIVKTINILDLNNSNTITLNAHNNTKKLYISSGKRFRPTLQITGLNDPVHLESLELIGVTVDGPISINCQTESLEMAFMDVIFNSESVFSTIEAKNCYGIIAHMVNVTVSRPNVHLQALHSSEIWIKNSTFSSPFSSTTDWSDTRPGDAEITARRRKRDVGQRSKRLTNIEDPDTGGILIEYLLKGGKHNLQITDSSVSGLKQVRSKTLPVGALMVYIQKSETDVKVRISNSSFVSNHRAIDFSLKGLPDIRITNCTFENNSAAGSGGAIRLSASLTPGFGVAPKVAKTKIFIVNCTFNNNLANQTGFYNETDLYFQTRSPGSGGAIYVFIIAPSQLHQDGLVSIVNSSFTGNTAVQQGGTFFVNRDISTQIINSTFENFQGFYRPKIGDIIQASCNMTLENVNFEVKDTDSSAAVIAYQASDPSNSRLLIKNTNITCPTSHRLDQLNTSSLAAVYGIESFQMFCRVCPEEHYSLNTTKVYIHQDQHEKYDDVRCVRCPYGAECTVGIQNNQGFWGQPTVGEEVIMYQCPQEYCEQDGALTIGFDRCKEDRIGILCGRCDDGFSESMFNTDCISNDGCGWGNYWVLILIMSYGIFYLLFFLFEKDYDKAMNFIVLKLSAKKEVHTQEPPQHHMNDNTLQDQEPEEDVDVSKNGYFQIVMYFVQTIELLQVRMLMAGPWNRPKDILDDMLIEWVGIVLSFDAFALNFGACLFSSITPVLKTVIKIIYVLYIFGLLLLVYLLSTCCCFWMKPADRYKVTSEAGNNARILMTVISLLLYTYQSIAEYAFQLLNCVSVNGSRVLFYDGNVPCMQDWQYIVIGFVVVFIFPFFIVLLFGPKLLKERKISLGFFFLGLGLPLFMAVPMILWYFNFLKPPRKPLSEEEEYTGPMICCHGEGEEISDEIVEQVSGVYRYNLWGGVCWEGIMNLRRLVMVVFYSFITNMLIRQMMMSMACFVILILHVKVHPFMEEKSNTVEFVSLCTLLIVSGMNMIKAAYLQAQALPQGSVYYILVIYEWIEVIFISFLPLLLIAVLIVAVIVLLIRKVLCYSIKPGTFLSSTKDRQSQRQGHNPNSFTNYGDQPPLLLSSDPRGREMYSPGALNHGRPYSGGSDFLNDSNTPGQKGAYYIQRLPQHNGKTLWQNKANTFSDESLPRNFSATPGQGFENSSMALPRPKVSMGNGNANDHPMTSPGNGKANGRAMTSPGNGNANGPPKASMWNGNANKGPIFTQEKDYNKITYYD